MNDDRLSPEEEEMMRRKMEDEEYERKMLEINKRMQRSNVLPDNMIEMQSFIVRPDAERDFSHINKDLTTSYLYDNEITSLRNMGDMIWICERFGMKKAKDMFIHDASFIIAVARSRRGFERKMLNTNIQSSKQIIEQEDKTKRGGVFNFRRK